MKAKMLMMLAGLVLLGACKGRGNSNAADTAYQVINNDDKALAGNTDTAAQITKLIKTGQMKLKVKDVHQSSEALAALTAKFNGMVMHHGLSSNMEGSRSVRSLDDSVQNISVFNTVANITVKIPSEKLEDFMNQVGKMGIYVNERRMDIEDHTFDYMATQMRLQARRQIISQQQSGKIVIKNPGGVLMLKDDIVDGQVESRRVEDAVKYSIVELNLYQSNTVVRETVVNDNLDSYRLPFMSRVGVALKNGVDLFGDFIVGITNIWVFLLLGLTFAAIYIRYRRKYPATKPTAV